MSLASAPFEGSAEAGVWGRRRLSPSRGKAVPGILDVGCLLIITLLMILYPFEYDTGRSNFSLGDGLVILVAAGYGLGALRRPLPLPRYTGGVLVLVLVSVASITVNVVRPDAFFTGARVSLVETSKLIMAALWMCAVFWLLSHRFARRFLQLGATSVLFATGAALGSIAMTITEATDVRPTGPFENANLYAGYLSFNIFLALATHGVLKTWAERDPRRPPVLLRLLGPALLLGCVPALLLGIVSTGSRGGLIGTAGGLALSGFCRLRLPKPRQVVVLVGVVAVAFVGIRWYVNQGPLVLKRLVDTAEGDPKGVGERLMLWQAARETFEAHPILGAGYGQFRYYAHVATGENKVAHQTYLSMAAELGVIGLIVFGCLILAVLRDTLSPERRPYAIVTRSGRGYVLAVLVQGMFMNVQHSRAMWICFGVLAVQAAANSRARGLPGHGAGAAGQVWRQA